MTGEELPPIEETIPDTEEELERPRRNSHQLETADEDFPVKPLPEPEYPDIVDVEFPIPRNK